MDRPINQPPPAGRMARFDAGFGTRALLTVDAEEEFDWNGPFTRADHGVRHVPRIDRFQQFCEGIGVSPVYLVDWPIAQSPQAVEIIGDAIRRGTAEVGIQLHPWVNPPFAEQTTEANSYAGNLPPDIERAKFLRLRDRIVEAFGHQPMIYRAGRYGLGRQTAELLRDAGIAIDTSVRTHFDYRRGGGPDYRRHPLAPYWVDGDRRLLELPLTTVFAGALRGQGRWLHPLASRLPVGAGAFARAGLLERIALTPEGVTISEALRGVDMAIADRLPVLVLSFHSPSLVPGHTPYVRTDKDLDRLYDWFRQIYGCFSARGVAPTTVREIMAAVER